MKLSEYEQDAYNAISHLDCSEEIKLAIVTNKYTLIEEFEAIGGTKEIYWQAKDIIIPIAQSWLRRIEKEQQEYRKSIR